MSTTPIGIIGAGAWGTALAQCFASAGRDVLLWAREPEVVRSVNEDHENRLFLPGVALDPSLKAMDSLDNIAAREVLLLVTPAQHLRAMLESLKDKLTSRSVLVVCSKGVEIGTGLLISQIAQDVVPNARLAILTGPTFASEVARGLPAAVTIGTADHDTGLALQSLLGTRTFRPYLNDDLVGTQLGGAVKNVVAVACGIIHGKGLGESARAALMTRGVAETVRLGMAMGARQDTFFGMCGIGDLMLTASSMQSRNFSLGEALGRGEALADILQARNAVTEGVYTARALVALADRHGVDMPVTQAVDACVNGGQDLDGAIENMLNRPFRRNINEI